MYKIKGKFTDALVTNDLIAGNTIGQLQTIINQPVAEHTHVALMPDGHFGAGVPVGMTMRMLDQRDKWQISPTIISGDIGCGMTAIQIDSQDIDFKRLDQVINTYVPNGFGHQVTPIDKTFSQKVLNDLSFTAMGQITDDAMLSLGSLGGGNHFIEIDKDSQSQFWLVIHCGSRHFGTDILAHHMNIAEKQMRKRPIQSIINHYKSLGQFQQIASAIEKFKQNEIMEKDPYAFLTGNELTNYLYDVVVGQQFAAKNRALIAKTIINHMDWHVVTKFETVHNYFDDHDNTIRKGATSAQTGKKLLIPLNMRDGSLICVGKGNPDWNFSAPHGAGRILSRAEARNDLKLQNFEREMQDIYSTSVVESTIDEAPDAYKPMAQIIDNIGPTAEIVERISPVYNFKAK